MTKKQAISDLQASVQDVFDNLRAVKGDPYANTVAIAHMGLHFARLLKQISVMNDVSEENQDVLFHQHSQLMKMSLKSISDGYGMSEVMLDEILDWASKLDDKVVNTLEQLSKEQ